MKCAYGKDMGTWEQKGNDMGTRIIMMHLETTMGTTSSSSKRDVNIMCTNMNNIKTSCLTS
jgi:hypothetical protein